MLRAPEPVVDVGETPRLVEHDVGVGLLGDEAEDRVVLDHGVDVEEDGVVEGQHLADKVAVLLEGGARELERVLDRVFAVGGQLADVRLRGQCVPLQVPLAPHGRARPPQNALAELAALHGLFQKVDCLLRLGHELQHTRVLGHGLQQKFRVLQQHRVHTLQSHGTLQQ